MNLTTYTCRLLIVFALIALTSFAGPQKGRKRVFTGGSTIQPFDAVIVPGIPFDGKGWDSVMKSRVLWSWILYKNGYARNIIYSGSAVYTPYVEAMVMGMYGEQLGIPREHIFCDTQARHSTENVYFSYLLAKKQGFKSIALATDPFQAFMLRGFTRKRFATPIYHIPFITDSLKLYNHLNPVINAKPARVRPWTSIKDQQGFAERMKGTLGKTIDWKQYPGRQLDSL